jgi:putative transposase
MLESSQDAQLSLSSQARLLSLSRSGLYYRPRPVPEKELRIKHRLDELYTEHPFLGSRKLVTMLAEEGLEVSRHTIRHYRAQMGLCTLYPKPRLSTPGEGTGHRIYPYLLREMAIERPNQVWGVDITYIRLVSSWMYLVAFLDWYSRYVIAWELSDTLEMGFVLACRDAALTKARPEIVNSDQGSHFTSERFTQPLTEGGVRISMDGRGRCMDNIFTERLWRSVKYEEVYLSEYESPQEARRGIGQYLAFYNQRRPHQSLGNRTPADIYGRAATESKRSEALTAGEGVT